jgi:hypothetical protein
VHDLCQLWRELTRLGFACAQTLTDRMVDRVDEEEKPDIVHWAAFYELRMRAGNKKIYHLEAFVAKIMSLHKVCPHIYPTPCSRTLSLTMIVVR